MQLCHCAELLVTKPRLFQCQPGNCRFAVLLPDSEVILVVDIAEIPEKRAFRGVPHPFLPHAKFAKFAKFLLG